MTQKSTEDGLHGFLALCATLHSPEELRPFFDLFFTIEEKETIASRFLIVKELLEQARTQREISDACKVSIAQITRGSNALKIIDPGVKEYLLNHLGISV